MQAETGHLADRANELILRIASRQCLQGEHLVPSLRPYPEPAGDQIPQQ